MTITACMAAWAAEPYVVYSSSNTTLTFYYGTKPNEAYSLNKGIGYPDWYYDGTYVDVTRVIFDSSFAQARPTITNYWFYKMENLTTITGLNYLNTSQVVNMMYMFDDCKNLTNLNLSSFNTEKVTNMFFMFSGCENLTSLDVSSFNTSNVTDMTAMFANCKKLTSLDLSNFNTSSVTTMKSMFNNCESLSNLNISSFNTSNVVNMWAMFDDCDNLTSLDLSHFDTSKVEEMGSMFSWCDKLSNLNLSSFNTSNVVHMDHMFSGCASLENLDLCSFNTSKVANMNGMFDRSRQLKTVKVSSEWSTDRVVFSDDMFFQCYSLEGGAGTTFDSNHVNKDYARIDGGPSYPGYLTGEVYDLWINDIQVTAKNCNDLSGITGLSGTVKYAASSKTLTLVNARLTCGAVLNKACIRSNIDGMTISLKGTNSILVTPNASDVVGMVLANTTLTGGDTLAIQGRRAGIAIQGGKTVTFNNVHNLVVKGTNGIYSSSASNTKLVVKGSGTNVLATGSQGAIRGMGDLELEDGLSFIEPEGGHFYNAAVCDASNNVATRVVIGSNKLRGDVNGDGKVNVSDVTTLINMILNVIPKDMDRGDINGDSKLNVSDVTALVNIILSIS